MKFTYMYKSFISKIILLLGFYSDSYFPYLIQMQLMLHGVIPKEDDFVN